MSNLPGQPAPASVAVTTRDLAVPSAALAVAAHPDDTEFGAGGTLAKWAAAGCVVHLLVCTDGSKGSWDPAQDTTALVALRQQEQRAAATRLGATGEVVFLGQVDGELSSDRAVRAEVVAAIRRLRPAVVLGHDPWRRYRLHPDHRHAGVLLCEAVVAAPRPALLPRAGPGAPPPRRDAAVGGRPPDHAEDVSGTSRRSSPRSEAHTSQHRSTMGIEAGDDGHQRAAFRDRIRSGLAALGAPLGLEAAELFKRISDL